MQLRLQEVKSCPTSPAWHQRTCMQFVQSMPKVAWAGRLRDKLCQQGG
jgi:hypothetical protein